MRRTAATFWGARLTFRRPRRGPARTVGAIALCALAGVVTTGASADTVRLVCLVVDLEGDGLRLGDRDYPVSFDVDGDGRTERVQWTAEKQREAFLWSDGNGDGALDPSELLGARLSTPADRPARRSAWRALADLDAPSAGGNGDVRLDAADAAWRDLRLWIDLDHDGVARRSELQRLADWRIDAFDLRFDEGLRVDGGLNLQTAWGAVTFRSATGATRRSAAVVTEVHLPLVSEPTASRRPTQAESRIRTTPVEPSTETR